MRVVILAIALLLWANVSLVSSRTVTVSAPMVISGLGSGLAVADVITDVEAKLSGSLYAVGKLTDDSVSFTLDLTGINEPGHYSRELTVRTLPEGIKLIGFSPKLIVFDVDQEVSKQLPVVIRTTGQVADDYSVEDATVVPDKVTVWGAARVLETISEARAYVAVDGRSSSFTAPVDFTVETAAGRRIQTLRLSPESGKAAVVIKQGAAFRNLGISPTFSGELPGGFWIREVQFEPPMVTVRGQQRQLQALTFLTTTPIDLSDRLASFYDQVAVDLPQGVEMVEENLISVHVIIDSAQDTRQLAIVPRYVNVTESFSVTAINPSSVRVVLAGNSSVIRRISRADVVLNLDLQGTLSGTAVVEVSSAMFEVPEGVTVVSFTPKTVEVVLSRLE